MILAIGTDIVEVARFERLKDKESFITKVYSKAEMGYIETKRCSTQTFAGMFAAKEAVVKTLGGLNGMSFSDIEILHGAKGAPFVHLNGSAGERFARLGGGSLSVSISHEKAYAIAFAVLEGQR